jgi:hypothetical protein
MARSSQGSIVAASRQSAALLISGFLPKAATPQKKRNGCRRIIFRYISAMIRLTKQEQLVLCVVLGLLLTGWAVKTYRTAHPPAAAAPTATP